ncbi:MAG: hypothetical protein JXA46_10360 [Dehalococcoidales bacterium]|nr:hypothetical protein [Dehalococcoidales bacterium]
MTSTGGEQLFVREAAAIVTDLSQKRGAIINICGGLLEIVSYELVY